MGLLVLDASVVLAVITGSSVRPALVRAAKGSELLAAACLPLEVGNGLSVLLGRGRTSLAEARDAADAYWQVPVRLVDVDLGEALSLSARLGISAYEAYPVVCARAAHCPLLTLDAEVAKAGRVEGVRVVEVDA